MFIRPLVQIFRQELASDNEMIFLGDGRFILLSDLESRIELESLCALILDCAEEYDEEHPGKEIDAEATYNTFRDFTAMKAALEKNWVRP